MSKSYSKYRVLIETEASGQKWFIAQKKSFIFWNNIHIHYESNSVCEALKWRTLEEAQKHIQSDINYCYSKSQKKVISREYVV